jgi:peptidyl-prolyl cis-trans isomerase D
MLNEFRTLSKTWVAKALFIVLVASFAMWGVQYVFNAPQSDTVAVVGHEKISVTEVSRDFDRQLQQARGQIDRATAVKIGYPHAILQNLIRKAAVEQKFRDLGLVGTDNSVANELRENKAFQDPITGRFDRDTYLQLLAQNNAAPRQYESDLRLEIMQSQLVGGLGAGLEAPDVLATVSARFFSEKRSLSVVTIPADGAGSVAAPSAEELQAFYDAHKQAFAIPPRRAFSFVTLTIDDFLPDITVDEAQTRTLYDQRRESLKVPEKRDILEIAAPNADVAKQIADRLRSGEEAAKITDSLKLAPPNVYKDATPDQLIAKPVADAVFAAPKGQVTDPIDGGVSWFVARVDAITPGHDQTFEEAKPALEAEIAKQAANEKLFNAYDAFERARSQGASLEDAAAQAGVPAFVYGLVDQTGAFADGLPAEPLGNMPGILEAVFATPTAGVVGDLTPLGAKGQTGENEYFVQRVDRIEPSATQPLAAVEPQVRAQYTAGKQAEALNALAETARKKLADGGAPSDAAKTIAPAAHGEISELRRDQPTATVGRELLAHAFAAKKGDVVVGPTPDGGRAIVRVDAITPGPPPTKEQLDGVRSQVSEELSQDLSGIFAQSLQNEYKPRITNQQLLDKTLGSGS